MDLLSGSMDLADLSFLVCCMLVAGLLAGFAAGLFGIGGGFVVVPALVAVFEFTNVSEDTLMHLAVGTSTGTIILTSIRAAHAHAKRGAVDFDVLKQWAPWIIIGVCVGLLLANYVNSRQLMMIFAIGVMMMGVWMLVGQKPQTREDAKPLGSGLRAGLATFLGSHASLLGIGGGTFAIICLTLSGKSIHQAIATAAGLGAIIAVPAAIGFMIIGQNTANLPPGSVGYVNVFALAAISATTMVTAPMGVTMAHKLNPAMLRRVFAFYLMFTASILLGKGLGMF